VASGRALALKSLVTAFVYRRYLDYGVFEGLRQLHLKVRDEAQRRAAGRPERANDVKLSRGGIREIEFIVQLLLVVRGGQFPEIRTRSTLKALDKLAAGGLMPRATAERLADAYALLRRIEHRIQYLDDQQTHILPTNDSDLDWIAASLGHSTDGGTCAMLDLLGVARESVALEFDKLLHDGRRASNNNGCRTCGPTPLPVDAEAFLAGLPAELRTRVAPLCEQPKIRLLRDESKMRLAHLIGSAAQAVNDGRCTLAAAVQFVDWLEPLLRRESYLALLAERPEVQNRLLRLLGLARWPMRYLMLHPGVIDELADERLLHDRFDADEYKNELEGATRAGSGRPGREELLLDTLRRAHHAGCFARWCDVEGTSPSSRSPMIFRRSPTQRYRALRWAWQHLKTAHRPNRSWRSCSYGKLGGKELGYGGDLDVVFVYDDPGPTPTRRAGSTARS
jgi:glutamate-ammonia-ligase adenylyltransferase